MGLLVTCMGVRSGQKFAGTGLRVIRLRVRICGSPAWGSAGHPHAGLQVKLQPLPKKNPQRKNHGGATLREARMRVHAGGSRFLRVSAGGCDRHDIPSYVSGVKNKQYQIDKDWPTVEENTWMKLVVKQEIINGKNMFSIIMGGELQFSEENTTPIEIYNVEVWASDPWYPTPNALIRNLILKTVSCMSKNIHEFYDFFV